MRPPTPAFIPSGYTIEEVMNLLEPYFTPEAWRTFHSIIADKVERDTDSACQEEQDAEEAEENKEDLRIAKNCLIGIKEAFDVLDGTSYTTGQWDEAVKQLRANLKEASEYSLLNE